MARKTVILLLVACTLLPPMAAAAQDGGRADTERASNLPSAAERRDEVAARIGRIEVEIAETKGRQASLEEAIVEIEEDKIPTNRRQHAKAVEDRVEREQARVEIVLHAYTRGDPGSQQWLDIIRTGAFDQQALRDQVLLSSAEDYSVRRLQELDALLARLDTDHAALQEELAQAAVDAEAAETALATLEDEKARLTAELASVERQLARLEANNGGSALTGLGSPPDRPALAIKIDNSPAARPQSGLNQADVVYEELVEGGVTRFIAIFHSQDAERVGPIRSGRTSDLLILANLNRALFGASGGNRYVLDALRGANLVSLLDGTAGVFSRDPSRRAPHNLYSRTASMYAANPGGTDNPPSLFFYRGANEPVEGGRPVGAVTVRIGNEAVTYRWNGAGWQREIGGVVQADAEGVPYAPANVVIQFTPYSASPADARSPEAQVTGSGEAWVLTGGQLFEGSWRRPFPEEVTRFVDANDNEIPVTPGQTWILLPPPGRASVVG